MLNRVIVVVEHRADHPRAVELRETQHRLDPVLGNHFDVVVQKEDVLSTCMHGAEVDLGREVERFIPVHELQAITAERAQFLHDRGLRHVVDDDHEFEVAVRRTFHDASYGLDDEAVALTVARAAPDAASRDHDRHERFADHQASRSVDAISGHLDHFSATGRREMLLKDATRRLECDGIEGDGVRTGMKEATANVLDHELFTTGAQCDLVQLCPPGDIGSETTEAGERARRPDDDRT